MRYNTFYKLSKISAEQRRSREGRAKCKRVDEQDCSLSCSPVWIYRDTPLANGYSPSQLLFNRAMNGRQRLYQVPGILHLLRLTLRHILRGCPMTELQIKITSSFNHGPTRFRLPQPQSILGLLTPGPTRVRLPPATVHTRSGRISKPIWRLDL